MAGKVQRYGAMRDRVGFDAPTSTPDGYGGVETGWADEADAVECAAELIHMRGSESVDAARLAGRAVLKVRIGQSDAARAISTDWRMRDLRRGTIYNLRDVDSVTDRHWIWIMAESGVAV